MAKQDVVDFLTKLVADPKLREQLKKDPDGTLRAATGLTAIERAALKSGDPDAILAVLEDDTSALGAMILLLF